MIFFFWRDPSDWDLLKKFSSFTVWFFFLVSPRWFRTLKKNLVTLQFNINLSPLLNLHEQTDILAQNWRLQIVLSTRCLQIVILPQFKSQPKRGKKEWKENEVGWGHGSTKIPWVSFYVKKKKIQRKYDVLSVDTLDQRWRQLSLVCIHIPFIEIRLLCPIYLTRLWQYILLPLRWHTKKTTGTQFPLTRLKSSFLFLYFRCIYINIYIYIIGTQFIYSLVSCV